MTQHNTVHRADSIPSADDAFIFAEPTFSGDDFRSSYARSVFEDAEAMRRLGLPPEEYIPRYNYATELSEDIKFPNSTVEIHNIVAKADGEVLLVADYREQNPSDPDIVKFSEDNGHQQYKSPNENNDLDKFAQNDANLYGHVDGVYVRLDGRADEGAPGSGGAAKTANTAKTKSDPQPPRKTSDDSDITPDERMGNNRNDTENKQKTRQIRKTNRLRDQPRTPVGAAKIHRHIKMSTTLVPNPLFWTWTVTASKSPNCPIPPFSWMRAAMGFCIAPPGRAPGTVCCFMTRTGPAN